MARRLLSMETTSQLITAIQECRIVRLGYRRQRDEMISLHFVAPVDIRMFIDQAGDRAHLWAYCFDEGRLERHLLDRVVSVTDTPETFSPREILAKWPDGWLLPDGWTVPRDDDRWSLARP